MIKKLLNGFYLLYLLTLIGCSPQGVISSSACLNNNANCASASTSIAFQGSDSDSSSVSVGANGSLGSLKIKTVRYGEQILLEFVVTNPGLSPLTFASKALSPGDAAFTDGDARSAKSCIGTTLLYSQSCSVAILYKPNDPAPAAQTVQLNFKTFLGEDFIINSGFDANSLLADFYVDPTKLALPDTFVHDVAAGAPVSFQFNLENHGQDVAGTAIDLKNIHYSLKPGSACTLSDGLTGPCSAVTDLAGKTSCELTLTYKPTTAGLQTCDLLVSASNGISQVLRFQGNAYQWTTTQSSLDFGTSNATAPIVQTLHLNLPSGPSSPATACTFNTIGGTNASQFAVTPGGTCTSSVAGGTDCDINVQWTPIVSSGDAKAQLQILCDTRGGNLTIPLHGRKTSSLLIASTNEANFGDVLLSSTKDQTIQFTNTDASPLTGLQITLNNLSGTRFAVQSSTCASTLAAGASCNVVVRLNGTAIGNYSASLTAKSTQATLDSNIALVGSVSTVRASQARVDFGSVVPTKDRPSYSFEFKNPTSVAATGCRLDSSALSAQNFVVDYDSSCYGATSLAAGASCNVKVHYTAKSPEVDNQAALSYVCSVGGTATVQLSGSSRSELRLVTLPPAQADAKKRLVGITQDFDFVLANSDLSADVPDLSVTLPSAPTSWSLVSAGASDCANLASGTLLHSDLCKVRVRFNPSATAGSEAIGATTGALTLSSSDGTLTTMPSLKFSGEAVKIQSSAASYDMNIVPTGTAQYSQTFVFSNPSDVDTASSCTLSTSAQFVVTNSTCTSSLAPLSSCSTQVVLPSQSASADFNETLDYTCSVGGRARVALHAYVQKPPTLSLTGTTNLGYVDIGQTYTTTMTLTHTGVALDDVAKAVLAAVSNMPEFQITANNCPTQMSPTASCTIDVTWTPSISGTRTATLSVTGSNFATLTASFTGEAVDPTSRVVPSPMSVSFLGHLVGSHTEQTITVSNNAANGTSAALVSGALSQGLPWSVSNDLCNGNTLAIGANCTMKINFDPSATGTTSGTYTVSAGAISKTISYAGSAEQITNSVSSVYNFGDIDIGAAATSPAITIANPSSLDHATSCNYTIDSPFTIDGTSTCAATINSSSSCSIKVTLPSQSSGISLTGKKLNVDCAVGGHTEVALSAEVKEIPKMNWTGTVAFGEQDINTEQLTQTFTLTNPKSYAIDLTSFGFVGSDSSFTITATTCAIGNHMNPGDSCTVTVNFQPTTSGNKSIVLRAGALLPNPYNNDITLTGKGTTMSLALSVNTLAFGPVELGFAGPHDTKSVVITNNGNRVANLGFTGLTNPPFGLNSGTCATIAAGANCTIQVSSYAEGSTGNASQTLTLTETQNAHNSTKTVAITGSTVPVAALAIKDTRAQSTFITTIATTDITGPTDDANNIVNLIPANKSVTYTIRNNASGAGDISGLTVGLVSSSGATGTMTVANDTCTGTTIAALATCTFDVVYTPTTNNETSDYALTVTGTSVLSGNTVTAAASHVVGHSLRSVSITSSPASITFGPTKVTQTATSGTITITNNGDRTATGLSLSTFTGTNSSVFTVTSSTCGSTLAGQASCTYSILFSPTQAASFVAAQDVVTTQQTTTSALAIKAASYNETTGTLGAVRFGLEGDVTSDGTYYYFASRSTDGTVASAYSRPVITVCPMTTESAVNTTSCQQSEINDGTRLFLSGIGNGSGPRIQQSGNKIFVALQNQENDSSGYGDATILSCIKKGSSSPTLSDCAILKPHTSPTINKAGAGLYPAMVISGDKLAMANQTHTGFIITVCDIDTAGTDPSNGVNVNTCKAYENATLGDNNASYISLAFNGAQAVVSYFTQASTRVLMGTACTIGGDNTPTCGSNSVIDNQSVVIGGDTFEPGVYPSMVMDGTKFYVAHQAGENIYKASKLSTCDFTSTTTFTCASQVTAQSADSSGLGLYPSLQIVGSGTGAHLWINYVVTGDYGDRLNSPRYEVRYCTTTATTPTCAGSAYLTQATSGNPATVYSRRSYYNTTGKLLVVPYAATTQRLGLANIGLTPEL
ncbi:choice-of-anchor D domain-containing protein [Bdellovibrio sp. NC01]|uniref:choice-of-anchor D domain-containing protein n=1 Tax=Bdellovibrio sp. NC01 TaxID=2220073 RepID=UPI00143D4423|nr:choice-of-anchor D domain-containing protein [Bdellovibrio sp. NC01]